MTASSNPVSGNPGAGFLGASPAESMLDRAMLQSADQPVLMSGSRQEALLGAPRQRPPSADRRPPQQRPGSPRAQQLPTSTATSPRNPQSNIASSCFPNTIRGPKTPPAAAKPSNTTAKPAAPAKEPIAAAASVIAKERETMYKTLDGVLDSVMGKGNYAQPKDHRGYVALLGKAAKMIKTPAGVEAFKAQVAAAGLPSRLNFGLSTTVAGKAVALNSNLAGPLDQFHQAEQQRIAAEFGASAPKPRAVSTPSPSPTPSPTPASPNAKPVSDTATPQGVFDDRSMTA